MKEIPVIPIRRTRLLEYTVSFTIPDSFSVYCILNNGREQCNGLYFNKKPSNARGFPKTRPEPGDKLQMGYKSIMQTDE